MESSRSARSGKSLVWIVPHSLTDKLHASARVGPARALQSLGWDVTFVAAESQKGQRIPDLDVYEIPLPAIYFLGQTLFHIRAFLYVLFRCWQQDVIFFHQASILWLWPLGLLRLLPSGWRPLVVMDTRDLVDAPGGTWRIRLRMHFYRVAYRTLARAVDGQTAITERMAELIDVPDDKLLGTWPSGVYLEPFLSAHAERSWPQGNDPIEITYIGILLPRRNPLPLCHAVESANSAGMSFRLTLVGSGRSEEELRAFAQSAGGRIRVLAPVSHGEVPTLLAQAHIGATSLPEVDDLKYAASSPIKLFEYMAAGLPVLATTSVCHTDVVKQGRYAFWVEEPTEKSILSALQKIWEQRAELSQLGMEAAEAAQGWSWMAAGRKLEQALLNGLEQLDSSRLTEQVVGEGR